METRVLGRSGLELPVIGFGCGPHAKLMVGDDHRLQSDLVRYAIERGVDYFDTAAAYGDGRSETNLGQALSGVEAHPRISTKVVLERDDLGDVRSAVLRNFEASLGRLRLARVDALMLHNRVATSRDYKTTGIGAVLSEEDVYGRAWRLNTGSQSYRSRFATCFPSPACTPRSWASRSVNTSTTPWTRLAGDPWTLSPSAG